ncbi:ribonuclease H-like domain-containing protein [Tanacetum coccineum]
MKPPRDSKDSPKQMYEHSMLLARSLPSEWSMHVVVWRNKLDLGSIIFDDLYNNFKIVEQEVKRSIISSSNSSSQNVAIVLTPSSTDDVNTSNVHVSTASSSLSTASSTDNTARLMAIGITKYESKSIYQRTGKKIIINGSDTAGYDKTKVECFNCHKMGHFARECRNPRSQENRSRNQDNSRRTVNVEESSSKAMLAIDGVGFDWSFMTEEEIPTNFALMAFSDSEVNKSVCENSSNEIKKTSSVPIIEDWVSDCDEDGTLEKVSELANVQKPKQADQPRKISQNPRNNSKALQEQTNRSTAMPIKTAAPKPFVNVVKSRPNAFQKSHSPSRRSFCQHTTLKNRNLNNRVNTVKVNSVNTAKGKRVMSAVGKQGINAAKSTTCWVWRPTIKVLDHVSKNNGLGLEFKVLVVYHTTNGHQFTMSNRQERIGYSRANDNWISKIDCLLSSEVGDEAVHKELGDRMERVATTASSFEAEQDSDAQTRFEAASKSPMIHLSQEVTHLEVGRTFDQERKEADDIDWSKIVEQAQERQSGSMIRYQALKKKPATVAQARKNMMVYLKNMANYKMKYFKGMSYDQIRPIFEKEYNKVQTLFKKDFEVSSEPSQEQSTEEPKELSEEDLKEMLEIVLVEETKVEALQVKYPIVDWEVHTEGSRKYWKIIRVGNITEAYQGFEDMLKWFDREDLDTLWSLVKGRFRPAEPSEDMESSCIRLGRKRVLWGENLKDLFESR